MASRQSPNLHPIVFKRNPEQTNGLHDDISQLFANVEDDSLNAGKKQGQGVSCSPWFCDTELIVYKLFYLFFYAATALFAYLPLYYKNSLLLDHHHVGILMGIRPFCGFLGAPILGSFADKFHKYKSTLYAGLLTYIIVYLSITFVNGVPKDCDDRQATRTNVSSPLQRVTGVGDFNFLNGEGLGQAMNVYNTENFAQRLANAILAKNEADLTKDQYRTLPLSSTRGKSEDWKGLDMPIYYSEDVKRLPRGNFILKKMNFGNQVKVRSHTLRFV